MVFCRQCSKKLTEDDVFCPVCGAKAAPQSVEKIDEHVDELVKKRVAEELAKTENQKHVDVDEEIKRAERELGEKRSETSRIEKRVTVKTGGFFNSMFKVAGGTVGCCVGIILIILIFAFILNAGR